jgi:hypothetical protein
MSAMIALAYLAPAMLVFVLLWLGRYPGAGMLAARRSRPTRARRKPPLRGSPRIVFAYLPRGGKLLAAALADRAPPLG